VNAPTDILVHYAEIALKGKNRPAFVGRLVQNLERALEGLPVAQVRKLPGRLWITAQPGASFGDEALARVKNVIGIATYSPVYRTPLDMDAMKAMAWELMQEQRYETFRVTARRAFKDLPFGSMQVNMDIGGHLLERRPAKVKMEGADIELYVEMVPGNAYLYVAKHRGLAGLPVGASGKVCCLLSGGIDSPVAAFRMMRRGCTVVFVHFHAHPFVTRASLEKAEELVAVLAKHQIECTLYAVPFGETQSTIVEQIGPPLRVVLYRRFMMRIAGALARIAGAKALVTGEAVGQVASQTLTNLTVIDQAAPLTVLRPLVGMDKQEIVDQAQALGTFETSILPDQDCCTLFVPRSPETHAKLADVEAAEAKLDVKKLVEDCVARAEKKKIAAPWHRG
jgi:tRNA uracil 4-sulfurtransferase